MIRLILTGLLVCGAASTAEAHAFHVSVAEAEVNHKTKRIEVALRVHPSDLERALGRLARRRIQLEKEPKIDVLITNYLQSSIQLTVGKQKPAKLVWVGKEVDVKWAWLYFEILLPKDGLNGATLSNKVFLELMKDQVNTMVLKDRGKRQTLAFSKDQSVRKLKSRE